MSEAVQSKYKFLNNNGRIPQGTMCPFNSFCFHVEERCSEVKVVDFSCACARFIDMFWDDLELGKEVTDD